MGSLSYERFPFRWIQPISFNFRQENTVRLCLEFSLTKPNQSSATKFAVRALLSLLPPEQNSNCQAVQSSLLKTCAEKNYHSHFCTFGQTGPSSDQTEPLGGENCYNDRSMESALRTIRWRHICSDVGDGDVHKNVGLWVTITIDVVQREVTVTCTWTSLSSSSSSISLPP